MESRSSKQKTLYIRVFVVTIIITIAGGWLLTDFLGSVAEKEFKEKVNREANLTAALLHDNLSDVEDAAKVLGHSEQIVEALSTGSSAGLERANRTLDRFKSSFEVSVCYLMDKTGLCIASSNRNEKNGFVGKSFAFRPFVTGALAGRLTTYFGLGVISHERGFYAAAPVTDSKGAITGVVVIKKDVAPVGELFRKNTEAFLVSPEGIIFISSKEESLYGSLWPIDEKRRSELVASRQFGNISFNPLLAAEPRTGTYVRFENKEYYVQRLPFGSDGWTLVFMDEPRIVSSYHLFGILLTTLFVLLFLFFFILLLYKYKSLEAARALLKSRDDWKQTFDAVPDLIATIDSNYHIINMNRAMAERLGISQNEATGRLCCELVHGCQDPPPYCPHRRVLISGRTESETLFEMNLNGDFIVTASPLLTEDGAIKSTVHVMHEVTEMKRLSDEVNRISNLASIGLLAGGLAHDFNNTLNIIYGNISFAKILSDGNSAIIEPLTDAEEACERAKELGIRLQAFSQGNSAVKEPVTLAAIIEDVADTLFKDSNISLTVTVADDLHTVEADPRQIRQVFENLLTNAKEADSGGGAVKINIDNYIVGEKTGLPIKSGNYVRITLQDDGKGIPEENLPKIFDPYFSTKDTYSKKGLGLGLSICHAILKRHHGHISVESTAGIGTKVTLYLPASE